MANDRTTVSWYPAGPGGADDLAAWVSQRDWVCVEAAGEPTYPYPIWMNLRKGDDGRYACVALIAGSLRPMYRGDASEVTSRSLRDIPVADLIGSAIASGDLPDSFGAAVRSVLERAAGLEVPRRRPGPKGLTSQELEFIASAYEAALEASPRAPMQWLIDRLRAQGYSESTVRRHVQRARERRVGFFGKDTVRETGVES